MHIESVKPFSETQLWRISKYDWRVSNPIKSAVNDRNVSVAAVHFHLEEPIARYIF